MATLPIAGAIDQSFLPYNQPLINKIERTYIENEDPLSLFPMITKPSQIINIRRILGGLPTVTWKGYNESAPLVRTPSETQSDKAYLNKAQILWDYYEMMDENIVGGGKAEIGRQIESYIHATIYEYWRCLITNAHQGRTGDVGAAPVGIYERIDNSDYKIVSEMKSNANLDVSPGLSAATAVTLMTAIHSMIMNTGSKDGKDCLVLMNKDMYLQLLAAVMVSPTGSMWAITKDQLGREMETIYGARIVNVGRIAPDSAGNQADYPITSHEQADGTPGTAGVNPYTSIVVVKTGEKAFKGWRFMKRDILRLGRNTSAGTEGAGTMDGVYISDYFGWLNTGVRDLGRIYGLKVK